MRRAEGGGAGGDETLHIRVGISESYPRRSASHPGHFRVTPGRFRGAGAPADDVRVDAEEASEDVGAEGARELALVLDHVREAALRACVCVRARVYGRDAET